MQQTNLTHPSDIMDGAVFLSLRFKDSGKLMLMAKTTTFDELKKHADDEWGPFKDDQVVFTSNAGDLLDCSLKNDNDMAMLYLYCEQFGEKKATVKISNIGEDVSLGKAKIVENPVFVHSPLGVHSPITPPVVANKRKVNQSCSVDEFSGRGSLPNYGASPLLEKKSLLSDGWKKLITGDGQVFEGGAVEFRDKLIRYTTKLGFCFDYNRNDSRYVHAVCTEKGDHGCPWFIKAGRQSFNKFFVINQSHLVHNCVGKLVTNKKSRLGASVLGKLCVDNLRQDPTTRGKDVLNHIKGNFGVDVSYSRAHRTMQYSKGQIFGTYAKSYNNLPWYIRAVKRTNPGSVGILEREPDSNHFRRVFIAYHASLEAFKTCRPMLFIDGTFPKGRAKGTILAATAKDGNNGLVPVAFAVVSTENLDNWQWFLENLRDYVKHSKEVYYISDRHPCLMSAFPKVFDKPVHFFCLQHLKNNLQALFGGKGVGPHREKMWELFKELAYAPTIPIFLEKLKLFIEEGGPAAADWLETIPYEKWALAYSAHILRYGEMTSNAIESFNHWILPARGLPVTYMIDCIRMGIMGWFVERRKEGALWNGALCQHKEEHWNAQCDIGASWNVLESTCGEYEVLSPTSAKVNLETRECTCYQWQIRGFPCAHAVAVIRKVCNNISDVVDPYFFVATYKECYSYDLKPIPQSEQFIDGNDFASEPPLLPPKTDSKLGRPSNKRRRNCFEVRVKRKPAICKKCGLMARHDEVTCGVSYTRT